MLKSQLSKGNNGLVKHKYITFSIEAGQNMTAAKSGFPVSKRTYSNNFKVLGYLPAPQTGYERLQTCMGYSTRRGTVSF